MVNSTTTPTSLTLPNGAVKQNRRILLDDLSGRQYEYTVSPMAIHRVTSYQPYHGVKYLSGTAAVINCIRRLIAEWRAER